MNLVIYKDQIINKHYKSTSNNSNLSVRVDTEHRNKTLSYKNVLKAKKSPPPRAVDNTDKSLRGNAELTEGAAATVSSSRESSEGNFSDNSDTRDCLSDKDDQTEIFKILHGTRMTSTASTPPLSDHTNQPNLVLKSSTELSPTMQQV